MTGRRRVGGPGLQGEITGAPSGQQGTSAELMAIHQFVTDARPDPKTGNPRRRPGTDMSKNVRQVIKTRQGHAGCQTRPLIISNYK